jgi:hypothetical protein
MSTDITQRGADCASIRRLLPLAPHGLLDEKAAADVRMHLAGCAACRAESAAYDRATAALRRYVSAATVNSASLPSRGEIARIVTSRAAPVKLRAQRRRGGLRRALAGLPAVAAVLMIGAIALALLGGHGLFTGNGAGGRYFLSANVQLHGVAMVSPDEGWAVADNDDVGKQDALLLHYIGGQWHSVALPPGLDPHVTLSGIAMVSASEGWAVGAAWPEVSAGATASVLLHYSGGRWLVVPTFAGSLTGIFMRTATDGWIVGQDTAGPLLLRYDGATWQRATDPDLAGYTFTSVAPVSATDVWLIARASGTSGNHLADSSTPTPTPPPGTSGTSGYHPADSVLHYDGQRWTTQVLPVGNPALSKIVMVSASEGWAVGGYCGCGSVQGPGTPGTSFGGALILHYLNGVWSEVTTPSHPLGQYLFDAAVPTGDSGWAVGFGGTLLRFSIGKWQAVSGPTAKGLLSVSLTDPNDGWAVGDQGTMLQLRHGTWSVYSGG